MSAQLRELFPVRALQHSVDLSPDRSQAEAVAGLVVLVVARPAGEQMEVADEVKTG